MQGDEITIEEAAGSEPDVVGMLVDLTLDEQEHYDHPREGREEVTRRLRAAPSFTGRNHLFVARSGDGRSVGVCWLVMYDPGTGLEAEIAELYVRPEVRGGGVARRLVEAAMELARSSHVTFASVWTRGDNAAALAAYRSAGFAPSTQTVLTWLPLPDG